MVIETELSAPCFLLAMPQSGDANFAGAVILILEHSDEGSMGLIINRPSDVHMGEFCEGQDMAYARDDKEMVYQGGPVQTDRAFILHVSDHQGPETEDVVDELKFSYSLDSMRELVTHPPPDLRFFLGYAGWGPGQLAEEVAEGGWLVGQVDLDLVFNKDSAGTWESALAQMGIHPAQLIQSHGVN